VTGSYLHYTQLIPTYLQLLGPGATFPTGTFPNGMIGAPETWERQLRLSAFATYTGFANHNLRLGLGHDDLNLYKTVEYRNFSYAPNGTPVPLPGGAPVLDFSDSAPFVKPQRRTVDYVYAQDEWNFAKDLTLTAGVRHDRYSDFGSTTNPRVALVWDATLDVTAKLLAGRAFRAPAFNEVYGITNPVALGNPNLRPETIGTVEAAIAWRVREDMEANLSLFRFDMKDLIRNVAGTYANTGAQNGRGAELDVVWDLSRSLRLSGNYAWQQSIDEATQQDAGYAPHHHVYARADWRVSGNWMTSTQVNWVADRNRAPGDVRPKIADYATLDVSVRTSSRKKQWEFSGSVRNLLNADVREPSVAPGTAIPNDLPMAPRSLYLQASYRL
jgi:outer membrane receptor protein involved in Fe transport